MNSIGISPCWDFETPDSKSTTEIIKITCFEDISKQIFP